MDNGAETRSTLSYKLRLAREQSGLSQGQVAKILGLHRPSVSEMEAGRRKVSTDELAQLAQLYDVSVEWLVGDEAQVEERNLARIQLAARELAKLKKDDLDRLLQVLATLRTEEDGQ